MQISTETKSQSRNPLLVFEPLPGKVTQTPVAPFSMHLVELINFTSVL